MKRNNTQVVYKWLLSFLFLAGFCGMARFCHMQTDGFKMTKIASNCPRTSSGATLRWSSDFDPIVIQRFTYLGRGKQSFAFLSEDKTTVLKVFNNHYQRNIFWYSLLPFCHKKVSYFQTKIERLSASYELANTELKDETGLLYLHLAPTEEIHRSVTLIDKLGIAHTLSLDRTGFALQKRGTLAYTHLTMLMDAGKREEALAALRSMVRLVVSRCKRGIGDNDPLVRTNLGFLHSAPFYIDIGPFSKDERMSQEEVFKPEIDRIMTSVSHWLEAHHPTLVTPFYEMIRDETASD